MLQKILKKIFSNKKVTYLMPCSKEAAEAMYMKDLERFDIPDIKSITEYRIYKGIK